MVGRLGSLLINRLIDRFGLILFVQWLILSLVCLLAIIDTIYCLVG